VPTKTIIFNHLRLVHTVTTGRLRYRFGIRFCRAASYAAQSAIFGSEGMVTVSPRSSPASAASTILSASIRMLGGNVSMSVPDFSAYI
jgi:hypothetical protein